MSKFQLFDAVSLTEPIAQNILFHCGTGISPVHHLRFKYSLTTKKSARLPALGMEVK
ncbi:hypothetical protein H6F71_23525 [Microcoleus sp. FACHB-61]|nr:hypothetical protein [Microcoleus sp. FACHB-61]